MVRVKSVILTAIFMAGWVSFAGHIIAPTIVPIPSSPSGYVWIMAAMGSAAVLFYFVRCETCHSSIYYTSGGKRTLFLGDPSSRQRFLFASRCPVCGQERF